MTHQQQAAFENIVGKGEIARNEQFLLFSQCFQLNQITVSTFVHIFDIISLLTVEWEEPTIGLSGKGLTCSRDVRRCCWWWCTVVDVVGVNTVVSAAIVTSVPGDVVAATANILLFCA